MITLTSNQAEDLQTLLLDHEIISSDEAFRTTYSGRGMFGSSCLGIVVDTSGFASGVQFALAVSEFNNDFRDDGDYEPFDLEWFTTACSDSMGLSTIIYWPNVTVES